MPSGLRIHCANSGPSVIKSSIHKGAKKRSVAGHTDCAIWFATAHDREYANAAKQKKSIKIIRTSK